MGIVFGYAFKRTCEIPFTVEECLALDQKVVFHALKHLHEHHSKTPWLRREYNLSNLFSRQMPINLERILEVYGMSHFRYVFANQRKGILNFDDINALSFEMAIERLVNFKKKHLYRKMKPNQYKELVRVLRTGQCLRGLNERTVTILREISSILGHNPETWKDYTEKQVTAAAVVFVCRNILLSDTKFSSYEKTSTIKSFLPLSVSKLRDAKACINKMYTFFKTAGRRSEDALYQALPDYFATISDRFGASIFVHCFFNDYGGNKFFPGFLSFAEFVNRCEMLSLLTETELLIFFWQELQYKQGKNGTAAHVDGIGDNERFVDVRSLPQRFPSATFQMGVNREFLQSFEHIVSRRAYRLAGRVTDVYNAHFCYFDDFQSIHYEHPHSFFPMFWLQHYVRTVVCGQPADYWNLRRRRMGKSKDLNKYIGAFHQKHVVQNFQKSVKARVPKSNTPTKGWGKLKKVIKSGYSEEDAYSKLTRSPYVCPSSTCTASNALGKERSTADRIYALEHFYPFNDDYHRLLVLKKATASSAFALPSPEDAKKKYTNSVKAAPSFAHAFYAVTTGRIPGLYISWDECELQISGVPGAVYASFYNEEQAQTFLDTHDIVIRTRGFRRELWLEWLNRSMPTVASVQKIADQQICR